MVTSDQYFLTAVEVVVVGTQPYRDQGGWHTECRVSTV